MYIKIQVQWTNNAIHNNHSRYTLLKHKYNTNNINYAPFVYCFKLIILLLYIHAHYTCNIVRELCFIYPCFLYCYIPYNTGCNSSIEMYCIDIHCSI